MVNWKVKIVWKTVIKGDVSPDSAKEFAIEELREELGNYPRPNQKLEISLEQRK